MEYLINQVTEQCTVSSIPIDKDYSDVIATKLANGSDTVQMASPMNMFRIDSNYTYVGEVSVVAGRG